MISPPRQSNSKALADLVAKHLADQLALPVESRLAPNLNFKDLPDNTRKISVHPLNRAAEFETRDSLRVKYEIAIAVLERIPKADAEDLLTDECLALMESIGSWFAGSELVDPNGGRNFDGDGYEHIPLYDRDALDQLRIFGAAISVSFQRSEPRANIELN